MLSKGLEESKKILNDYHDEILKKIKEVIKLVDKKEVERTSWSGCYKSLLYDHKAETRIIVEGNKIYFEFVWDNSYDGLDSMMLDSKEIENILNHKC